MSIPLPTLLYATHVAALVTPPRRTSGFADATLRGSGDLLDAIGTLVVFEELALRGRRVSADITVGGGDDCDLRLVINDRTTTWNIKSSSFAPFGPGLHLFVKEEEASKEVSGFIQVFVHLSEDQEPHAHIAGVCGAKKLLTYPVREIPNTGGHRGYGVPVADLTPFSELVAAAAPSVFAIEAAA